MDVYKIEKKKRKREKRKLFGTLENVTVTGDRGDCLIEVRFAS